MAERVIHESDLSGELIMEEAQRAQITVLAHPELETPVHLDARPEELEQLGKFAMSGTLIEVTMPGEDDEEPVTTRYFLTTANFGKLAVGDRHMSEILAEAEPEQLFQNPPMRRMRNEQIAQTDYTAEDKIGLIHRGRVTAEEAALVRGNLEQANANRKRAGQPLINPTNEKDRRRYGLTAPEEQTEPAGELITLPAGIGRENDPT